MTYSIENLFFYFILYSVLGWIYETILVSIENGHTVNRGFLNGPYLPIYGFGSVLFLLLLGRVESPILIFFLAAVIACVVEYATSLAMEKLFGARWWDYSKYKFNLNGRICLGAATVFGAFAVLLIKFIHPFALSVVLSIPPLVFLALDVAMTVVFFVDLVITLKGFSGFNKRKPDSPLTRQQERLVKAFPTLNQKNYGKK